MAGGPPARVTRVRRPYPVLLAALLGAAALTAPTTALGAPPCTKAAARQAVRSTPAAAPLRATLDGPFALIAQLWCRDLTRDGARDMAFTVTGGGTAGIMGWAVFRAVRGRWRPALLRPDGVHLRVRLTRRAEVWEQHPVYRPRDPGCCPTGGYQNRRFRWAGTRFVVARRWHTRRAG